MSAFPRKCRLLLSPTLFLPFNQLKQRVRTFNTQASSKIYQTKMLIKEQCLHISATCFKLITNYSYQTPPQNAYKGTIFAYFPHMFSVNYQILISKTPRNEYKGKIFAHFINMFKLITRYSYQTPTKFIKGNNIGIFHPHVPSLIYQIFISNQPTKCI